MVRQSSLANFYFYSFDSRVPHREPQTTCGQKTLILYTASGYIDQKTKKFVRKGRNACLGALKKKHVVKISGSTLDRIVLKGKEAKGGVVCLERKKYDRSNLLLVETKRLMSDDGTQVLVLVLVASKANQGIQKVV